MARRSSLRFLVSVATFALCVPTASIAAGSPDLVPNEVKVSASSITPGQSMRVSWTMANKGDGDAKASVTGLRLKAVWAGSLKTSCAGPYITLVREIATDMIKAGGWISAQYDVAVPADAPAGGYVVEVVADNSNPSTLGQKDTGNDYAQSGEVTVSGQSASSTGRPLMADMELVPEGAFADPRYPLPLDEKSREHAGTDYRAAGGNCVFAVREGEVESNRTSTADPMEAVLIIKHGDGSRAYYGHIKSSLGKGSKVARGALLGTVRYPAPKFGSHLHYGEWAPPSDKSITNPETDCEKATWVTKQGDWGWGRVPLGTERWQMLKCGWIDTGGKYKTGWVSNAIPPAPVISQGACPFEGCQYGRWVARIPQDLYESIGGARLKRQVQVGEIIQAVSGTIYAMGKKAKVTNVHQFDQDQGITVGSTVYALYPLGEGAVAVWQDGKVKHSSIDLALEYETPIELYPLEWTWWVKVLLRDGTVAWIKNPTEFDGADRFGSPHKEIPSWLRTTTATRLLFNGPAFGDMVAAGQRIVLTLRVANAPNCTTASSGTVECQVILYSGGRPNPGVSMDVFRREFALVIDEVDMAMELQTIGGDVITRSRTFAAGATPGYQQVIAASKLPPGEYRVVAVSGKSGHFSVLWSEPLGD